VISQISTASNVIYFEDYLKARWNLTSYVDKEAPCLFFGVRGQQSKINDHKGFKLLYFVDRADIWQGVKHTRSMAAFYSPYAGIPKSIKTRQGWIEIRDNSKLVPGVLGNCIFVYSRHPLDRNLMGGRFIDKLKREIKFPILELCTTTTLPFEQVVSEYYSKCFAAVNFTETSGLTTVCDMGLLGVPTFMNTKHKLNSVIDFANFTDLIHKLNVRSRYIGTMQTPVSNYNLNDYWQNLNFWI
jgi:hypothetical protein